jgi:hypothetical protein
VGRDLRRRVQVLVRVTDAAGQADGGWAAEDFAIACRVPLKPEVMSAVEMKLPSSTYRRPRTQSACG